MLLQGIFLNHGHRLNNQLWGKKFCRKTRFVCSGEHYVSHSPQGRWVKPRHHQQVCVCECMCVEWEAGSTSLPAGYCPAADLAVSAVIRQRQATASWTPAGLCMCCLTAGPYNGCERGGLFYPPSHSDLKYRVSLRLVCSYWGQHHLCFMTYVALLHTSLPAKKKSLIEVKSSGSFPLGNIVNITNPGGFDSSIKVCFLSHSLHTAI